MMHGSNPRKLLEDKCKYLESIPTVIEKRLKSMRTPPESIPHQIRSNSSNPAHFSETEKLVMQKLLSDERLSLEQREIISAAILNGEYKLDQDFFNTNNVKISKYLSQISEATKKKSMVLNVHRHDLPKNVFLSLETETVSIPAMSAKQVHQQKIEYIRNTQAKSSPRERAVPKAGKSDAMKLKEMEIAYINQVKK